ncbi:MAG: M20 family metallo-hydrolase [Candidatus Bathyarchaeia archaeon]
MRINIDRLEKDLMHLGTIGKTDAGGRTRLTLTQADLEGRNFLITKMKEADLEVRVDKAGNIVGRRRGEDDHLASVCAGSHIDTVPNGGCFDGALGVFGPLEAVRTLNENKIRTRHPIEVISFTNEEGIRFPFFIGSKAMAGQLEISELYQIKGTDGVTFEEALLNAGLEIKTLVDSARKSNEIKAFLELHIEQGPVLDTDQIDIGVVEAIAGIIHLLVELKGRADHAGTTPMNMRKDPMLAAAKVARAVNELATSTGERTVGTVGLVNVSPGAMNVVPEIVTIGIDIRDVSSEVLQQLSDRLKNRVQEICLDLGVESKITERSNVPPVQLSKPIFDLIASTAQNLNYSIRRMPSGAGHDAMIMRKITQVGMIFVPSKNGRSHSPQEWTDWAAVEKGTNVLLHSLLQLAA